MFVTCALRWQEIYSGIFLIPVKKRAVINARTDVAMYLCSAVSVTDFIKLLTLHSPPNARAAIALNGQEKGQTNQGFSGLKIALPTHIKPKHAKIGFFALALGASVAQFAVTSSYDGSILVRTKIISSGKVNCDKRQSMSPAVVVVLRRIFLWRSVTFSNRGRRSIVVLVVIFPKGYFEGHSSEMLCLGHFHPQPCMFPATDVGRWSG